MHLKKRNAHRSGYAFSQVPFDLVVPAKTRIKSGDQAITTRDLTQDMNKAVSVIFTPERRGEVDPDQWIGSVSREGIMR
jgi:hypothetical protein